MLIYSKNGISAQFYPKALSRGKSVLKKKRGEKGTKKKEKMFSVECSSLFGKKWSGVGKMPGVKNRGYAFVWLILGFNRFPDMAAEF